MDPEEIENRQFLVQLRGYARDEVESFREEVAQEIKILRKQLTKATSDLSHANSELANVKEKLAATGAQLAEERSRPAPEVEATPEPPGAPETPADDRTAMFRMVGQETERILLAAEEAAEQIHDRAEKEAAELLADTRMRVERSLAEFDAARRAAEEDFAGIRDSRSMVASQLEDIRRRLEETISRLRVPVELPGSKPSSRFRSQPEQQVERSAPPSTPDRRQADARAEQRQQRELEAAKELQARQTAHRQEADRRAEELKTVQAEAEQRARAEAQRLERERDSAAQKARQAAELQAAVAAAREADRLKAERAKAAEEASAADKARAEQEAGARQVAKKEEADQARIKAEAEAKARSEGERAAGADVAAKEPRKREAEKAGAQEIARSRAAKERTASADQPPAGSGASSLDELLAEIRRKREEEGQAGTAEPASAPAPAHSADAVPEQLARRRDALGDLPAQTARRLKRLLQEEHNDLLDRLRTQRGKGEVDDNVAPHDEQLGRFVAGLSDTLGRAFSEGRKAAGSPDADSAAAVTKLVTRQVLNPLRGEISKAIEAGLQAEDSAGNLSERANDVFRVWKGVRTQLLGEGISYAAYHQGMIDGWSSSENSGKRWVLSADEQECPNNICRRNADAGAVALKAAFPSGHQAPPAHGGCTCTLKDS